MFDPSVGQWMEEDPIGFLAGDGNLRRYVGNNATNGVDPSGLEDPKKSATLVNPTNIPQIKELTTDASYEKRSGIDDGIAKGTMKPVKTLQGQVIKAVPIGKAIRGDGTVVFTIEKIYSGTYDSPKYKSTMNTVYFCISADFLHDEKSRWVDGDESLQIIQLVRNFKLYEKTKLSDDKYDECVLEPEGKYKKQLAGVFDPYGTDYWRVDNGSSPYVFYGMGKDWSYNDNDANPGKLGKGVGAKMWDAPGRGVGFRDSNEYGWDFQTALVSVGKSGKIRFLAALYWRMYIHKDGSIEILPPHAHRDGRSFGDGAIARFGTVTDNQHIELIK